MGTQLKFIELNRKSTPQIDLGSRLSGLKARLILHHYEDIPDSFVFQGNFHSRNIQPRSLEHELWIRENDGFDCVVFGEDGCVTYFRAADLTEADRIWGGYLLSLNPSRPLGEHKHFFYDNSRALSKGLFNGVTYGTPPLLIHNILVNPEWGFLKHISETAYQVVEKWPNTEITFLLTIPIFVIGFIKWRQCRKQEEDRQREVWEWLNNEYELAKGAYQGAEFIRDMRPEGLVERLGLDYQLPSP